jgi:hypothetical protein
MFSKIFTNSLYKEVSLEDPVSQLCTFEQFLSPEYERIVKDLDAVSRFHRKQWEFVYIIRCLEKSNILKEGSRGLVFGVGRERLPSYFASMDCIITATDLSSLNGPNNWQNTNQHCSCKKDLFHKALISEDKFEKNVSFEEVDMNNVPKHLIDYDFCWSSCALEHIGGLESGFNFIKNSLNCLKPGGIAVHTTEFNLSSNINTFESEGSSVYRKKDIENFAEEMFEEGHELYLNFNIGESIRNFGVDEDRSNKDFHLKLKIQDFISTSFGFFIRKRK